MDHKEDVAIPRLQPGPGAYNIPDSFGRCRYVFQLALREADGSWLDRAAVGWMGLRLAG